MIEQGLRAPVHASDDSYKLQECLVGNAEGLIQQAAAQNLRRNTLLLRESRIEAIKQDVRVNERDHECICPRASSLDQRQTVTSLHLAFPRLLHVAVAASSLDQTTPSAL